MKSLTGLKTAAAGRRFANVLRIASAVADGETVTIGNEVYEFDTTAAPGAVTAGNIRVDVAASQAAGTAALALGVAILANTQQGLVAARLGGGNELLVASRIGTAGRALACAETMAGANNAWAAAAMYGGSDPFKGAQLQARAANATEVALGAMRFVFPFNPVAAIVQVRTAAGSVKAWGGTTTLTGDRVDLANTGSTDIAATDVVTVLASE